MDHSEVSFRMGHEQATSNVIRVSSTNHQMRSSACRSAPTVTIGRHLPAPASGGDSVLNLGEDNGNVKSVLHNTSARSLSQYPYSIPGWIALRKPIPQAENLVITRRLEAQATLDINFEQILRQRCAVWSGIKIPATRSVRNYADTTGKSLLAFHINLYGATTKRCYENVCANCEKRERKKKKKKGIPSLIDFKAESDMIAPKDGKIRVEFVFCCYPNHHRLGDGEYL